ncbi:MAG: hypothetical protein Q9182_002982 [Xanthomendoza sp. 2 TL-2023]
MINTVPPKGPVPIDAEMEEVWDLVRDPRSRVPDDVVDQCINVIEAGSEAPIAALILTLLPNLRSMRWARFKDDPAFTETLLGHWMKEGDESARVWVGEDGSCGLQKPLERIENVQVTSIL